MPSYYSADNFTLHHPELLGEGVKRMEVEAYVRGRGNDRMRYLDVDCLSVLNDKSIGMLQSTVGAVEGLNYSSRETAPITDYIRLPLHRIDTNNDTDNSRERQSSPAPTRKLIEVPPPKETEVIKPRRQVVINTIPVDEYDKNTDTLSGRPPHRTQGLSPTTYMVNRPISVRTGRDYVGLPPPELISQYSPGQISSGSTYSERSSGLGSQGSPPAFTRKYLNKPIAPPAWANEDASYIASAKIKTVRIV